MRPIRILLVDDSRLFRVCAARMLASFSGIEIVGEAESAAEAFEKIESAAPDLVLLDISMPQMNGIEAAKRIKARSNAPFVAIVTLYDDRQFCEASMEAGADWFIVKDDFANSIATPIAQLISRRMDGLPTRLSKSETHPRLRREAIGAGK